MNEKKEHRQHVTWLSDEEPLATFYVGCTFDVEESVDSNKCCYCNDNRVHRNNIDSSVCVSLRSIRLSVVWLVTEFE